MKSEQQKIKTEEVDVFCDMLAKMIDIRFAMLKELDLHNAKKYQTISEEYESHISELKKWLTTSHK